MSRIPEYELDPEMHLFLKSTRSDFADVINKYYFDIHQDKTMKFIGESVKAPARIQRVIYNDIPDLTDAEYKDIISKITPLYSAVIKKIGKKAAASLMMSIAFDIADPRASKWMMLRGAALVKGITRTTMMNLRRFIAEGIAKGLSTPEVANLITDVYAKWTNKIGGVQSRANLIARTEMAYAANASTLIAYDQQKVKKVNVYDDEGPNSCAECKYIHDHDNVWTLDRAMKEPLQHPNCFTNPRVKIFTLEGYRHIRDIKVGDLVLTHKGKFEKVTELIRSKKEKNIPVYSISCKNGGRRIEITGSHPILTNKGWKTAEDIKIGDMIKVKAHKCACGNLIPEWKKYCSRSCSAKQIYVRNPELKNSIVINAHKRLAEKIKEGTHPLQQIENHIKANQALAKYKYQTWIERKIGWLLKENKIEAKHSFVINRNSAVRFGKTVRHRFYKIDWAIVDLKIAIECDGEYWHKNDNGLRDSELKELGWTVLHLTQDEIKNNLFLCQTKIVNLTNNHSHSFEFMYLPVIRKEKNQFESDRKIKLYNLSVENDESYIAKSYVVHNCVRAFGAKVEY